MGLTAGGEAASTFPVTKMSCWDNCWGIFYSDCHKGPPSPVWIPHRLEGITIYTENFHLHFSGDWLLTSHCFTEAQSLLFEPSKRIPFSPLALPGAPGNVLMLGSFECLELRGNQALEGNYCSAQLKEENILQTDTHISAKVRDKGPGWSNTGRQSHTVHEMHPAVFVPGRTFGEGGRPTVPPVHFMMRELEGWWNNWVGLSYHQLIIRFVSKAPATSL